MSYNSKRTIISLIAGILLITAYAVYALGERAPAPDNPQSWAAAVLVFIGIGVAAVIVIQIFFHFFTNEMTQLELAKKSGASRQTILRREKKCTFHAGCWLLTHENTERFLEDVFVCEYIIALEAGKYTPSLEMAFRIAGMFGVLIGEVFECKPEGENRE